MEYQRNELFVVEENNNSENEISEENNAGNADPVVQQPIVASTQTENSEEEFDEDDYSTEDDEDLMALYLGDLYTPPYRGEKTPKEDKESTSEPLTSREEETNAGQSQSSENPSDETQVEERMLERITDFFTKKIQNDMTSLAAICIKKWLSMPLAWKKLSVKNNCKVFDFASKLPVPESDSNTDD